MARVATLKNDTSSPFMYHVFTLDGEDSIKVPYKQLNSQDIEKVSCKTGTIRLKLVDYKNNLDWEGIMPCNTISPICITEGGGNIIVKSEEMFIPDMTPRIPWGTISTIGVIIVLCAIVIYRLRKK